MSNSNPIYNHDTFRNAYASKAGAKHGALLLEARKLAVHLSERDLPPFAEFSQTHVAAYVCEWSAGAARVKVYLNWSTTDDVDCCVRCWSNVTDTADFAALAAAGAVALGRLEDTLRAMRSHVSAAESAADAVRSAALAGV